MLLTLDIGNSTITWGLFRDGDLIGPWRLASDPSGTADAYGQSIADRLKNEGCLSEHITGAILCSVVPALTPLVVRATEALIHRPPLIVSPDMDTGLTLGYANPGELGTDRLVAAAVSFDRYKTDLIVVDLGTATTFTIVTRNGVLTGGAIALGLGTSAKALASMTAQLPDIKPAHPSSVIGLDTVGSIRSGLVHGHASLVDGLVTKMQEELGRAVFVVATGGWSSLIAPLCRTIRETRPNLTLEGLAFLYRRASGSAS